MQTPDHYEQETLGAMQVASAKALESLPVLATGTKREFAAAAGIAGLHLARACVNALLAVAAGVQRGMR